MPSTGIGLAALAAAEAKIQMIISFLLWDEHCRKFLPDDENPDAYTPASC